MNTKYLIKLWILTIFISPFALVVYELYIKISGQVFSFLDFFPIIILFSIFFSLPTLILSYFMIKLNKHIRLKNLTIKLVVWSVWVIGIIVTLQLISGSLIPVLTISYSVAALISIITLELSKKLHRIKL